MIINHNITAMNANRQMGINNGNQGKSIEKLSSGLKINRAGDDAAGLSISEKMRGQIRGLQQGSRNSQDGISMIQTAEGDLNETHSILQRMRELSVQAANGTNQSEDRDKISKEFEQLQTEITRIANDSQFNKKNLLNGEANGAYSVANRMSLKATYNTKTKSVAGRRVSVATVQASMALFQKSVKDLTKSLNAIKTKVDLLENIAGKLTGSAKADKLKSAATLRANSLASKQSAITTQQRSIDVRLTSAVKVKFSALNSVLKSMNDINNLGLGEGVKFQVGANSGQIIGLDIKDMRATALGVNAEKINIKNYSAAANAITQIDEAITKVSDQRASLGSIQNRLEHTKTSTDNTAENLQAAESRIRDVDMASEVMNNSKSKILSSAAQAMLAQANSAPQNVLQLLQ